MPGSDNLPVALNDDEVLHDIIEQELNADNQELLQSAEEIESNIATLQQIQQGTYDPNASDGESVNIEERSTSRKKKGFFGRVKSYFSFRKTGRTENPAQTGRQRADNHYQDYLIAKAAFDKQAYDLYQQSADGISITANDMASVDDDSIPKGKNNIVYGDILRLVGADAKFVHSVLRGKDNVTYSSSLAQLKMLGEYRTLKAKDNITLYKDFATDTEKLEAIASADFDIDGGRIHLDTGSFLIKNGNGRPALYFTNGSISLASEKFRLDLTKITASPEGITAGNVHLRLKEPFEDKGTDFDISNPMFLGYDTVISVPTGQDKSGPILMKNKDGMLTVGRVSTIVLGDLEYLGITFINARMTAAEDLGADGEFSDKDTFEADSAKINGVDFITMSNIKASRTEDSAIINSADITITSPAVIESVSASFKEFVLYKKKLPDFSKFVITVSGITFDDLVKINEANLTLSRDSKNGLSAVADIKGMQINAVTEKGFGVTAENVDGSIEMDNTDTALNISSTAAAVDCFGLFSVTADELAYSKGKFTADSIKFSAPNIIDKAGLLTLNGVSVAANKLIIDKNGLQGSSIEGEIAQFGMFDLPPAKVNFSVSNEGFSASAKLERDEYLIDNDIFKLLLKGTLNVSGNEGAFGVSFEGASLGLSIKDKNRLDIGSFSAADGVFSFSQMSGDFGITDVISAKLKDGSGTVSADAANINVNLEKLIFGSDSLTFDNTKLGVTNKNAVFNSDTVTVPNVFSLNGFAGKITASGVEGVSTKLLIDKPELKLEFDVTDAGISGDGLTFKEIRAGLGPIALGDFLSAQGSNLSIKKSDNGGYTLDAGFTQLKTNLSVGDLIIKTTTAAGSIAYSKTQSKVSFTGGAISASFRDRFGITMSGLSFENSTLRADSVTGTEITSDLLGGFVSLTKAKLSAAYLLIDKNGIRYDENGGVTLSAESVSMFGTALKKPELKWTNEGFSGKAEFEGSKPFGINDVFSVNPKGELGIVSTKQSTQLVTDSFSADFKLFKALTLGMNNITAKNGELVAKSINGAISLPAGINIAFNGTNLKVNSSGPSIDNFAAELPATGFLNNLVTVSGSMSAEKSFEEITAKGTFDIATDFLTAAGSAETDFSKNNDTYKQSFKRLEASGISSGKIISAEGLVLTGGQEGVLGISAKSISIPSIHATVDGIEGDISSKRLYIKSAQIHFAKIGDFAPVDTTVNELLAESGNVSFSQIKVTQEKGFHLGGILSAESSELIFSKEKNKPLCISAGVSNMNLDVPEIGPFGLSASGISGTVSYADDALSASLNSGTLTAKFSDLFSLQLNELSFKDGVFGASSVTAALSELSLMGDILSVSGMDVSAKNLQLSKTEISTGSGLNGTIKSIKMFSAELKNSAFSVNGNNFKASTTVKTNLNIGSFFSISADGNIAITQTGAKPGKDDIDKPKEASSGKTGVDLSGFSGKVMVFSSGFEVSGVSSQDEGMHIGEMKGNISLGQHFSANLSGKDILVGKDALVSGGPVVGTASAFDILGGALHFNESSLNITENLTKYDFKNSFTLSAGSVTGGGNFSASLEKGNAIPEIKLTEVNASIGGSSALQGLSLTYGENGVAFSADSVSIGEHITLSKLNGSVAQNALEVASAKISVTNQGKEIVNVGIENAKLGDSGFTFDEISTSAEDIDLGGFLKVKSTTLKLKNTKDNGFIAELMINNLAAKQELGGFFIKASGVSGTVTYAGSKVSAKTDSGSLDAGYLDIAKFSLSDISFADGILTGSVTTQNEGVTVNIFEDIITLKNAKLDAEKLSLGASGVKLAEGGMVRFTADSIGVLGKAVANPLLELTPDGFTGSADLEKLSFSPVGGTTITLDGKVGLEKKGSQPILPVTNNLNADISLFNKMVTLSAKQLALGEGALKAAAVNGTINAGGTTVVMNAGNVSLDNSGPKAELFTASIDNSPLMGNALRIRKAAVSAKNNFSEINAKGSIGLTFGEYSSGNVDMDVDFSQANQYLPRFNSFKLSMDILGASIKNLAITKQEKDGYAVSAEEISVPALSGAKISNISGTFSQNGLRIDEKAHFSMKKFADMKNDINKDLPAFSIDDNGLCFSNTSLGTADIILGNLLSSSVTLSLSREVGKGLSITADVTKFNINTAIGGFSVSGNTISGSVKYAEGKLNTTINGGNITAQINDLLKFSLNGISYSEEKGFAAANAEMLTKDFDIAGGMVKGTGLSLKGANLSFSAGGIGASDGLSGSITHFSLLKAGLDNVSFTIKPDSFSASADFSTPDSFQQVGPFSATAKGLIGISHQKGSFSAEFKNFSAYLEGLGANLSLTNVNSTGDGLTVEKITGGIKFGDKVDAQLETTSESSFKPNGAVIGNVSGTVNTVSFFSSALVFSDNKIKAENNLSDFYVSGKTNVLTSIMQTSGDYAIDILSQNSHVPHIDAVTFSDTNIKNVVQVSSLTLKDSSTAADFEIEDLKIGDRISVSKANGSFGNSALSVNSAAFKLSITPTNAFSGTVSDAVIDSSGLSFNNVTAQMQDIVIGDILTVSGANISITGTGSEYISDIKLEKVSANLSNKDFSLSVGNVTGSFAISTGDTPTSASIDSGNLTANYRNLLSFTVNKLSYKNSTLSIGTITAASADTISVADGLAGLSSAKLEIENTEFDANGFRFGKNGKAGITAAEFSLFSKPVISNVNLLLNPNGFSGSFNVGAENKPVMLGDDSSISTQLSGEVGINKANESLTATTKDFGAKFTLLDGAVVLSGNNITAGSDRFTAPALSGSVKYYGGKALSVHAENFTMDKNGPSFKTLTAKTDSSSIFDGALTISGMTFTANQNFESFSIEGGIGVDTSFLKTDVSNALVSFSAADGYVPSIDRLKVELFELGGLKITNLGLVNNGEKGLSISADSIGIPALLNSKITDISSTFTKQSLTLDSGKFSMDGFAGLDPVKEVPIPKFTIANKVLTFDEIKLGKKDVTIADILAIKQTDFSIKKTADDLIVYAKANGIDIAANPGNVFTITASGLSAEVTAKNGNIDAVLEKQGSIAAELKNLFKLTFTEPSYKDGLLSVGKTQLDVKEMGIAGVAKLKELTAAANNFGMNKDGFVTSNDSSVTIAGKLELIGKPFCGFSVGIENSGFKGKFTAADTKMTIADIIKLGFSGGIDVFYSGEKGADIGFDGFSASVDILNAVEAHADGIKKGANTLTADSLSGSVSALGKNIAQINAANVSIGGEGLSYSSLEASFQPVTLFNDMVTIGNDEKTVTSTDISQINASVKSAIKAGPVDISAVTNLLFSKDNSYKPQLLGIKQFNLTLGTFSMKNFSLSGNEESGALNFTGSELTIGSSAFKAVDIKGKLSKNEFTLTHALAQLNGVFDSTVTHEINNLSITNEGLFFENISFGQKDISLGDMLTAKSASISIENPKGGKFKTSAKAEDVGISCASAAFSLTGEKLTVSGAYSDGSASFDVGGKVLLNYADKLKLYAEGLSYSDGSLSAKTLGFEQNFVSILGGLVKIDGLSIAAKDFGLNKTGLSAQAINVSSTGGLYILQKKALSAFDFDLLQDGFKVDTVLSKEQTGINMAPLPVTAALSGHLKMQISNTVKTASFEEIGAQVTVFNKYTVGAENLRVTQNNELAADEFTGTIKLDHLNGAEFTAHAVNPVLSASGFDFTSFTSSLNGKHKFLNGLMSISNPKLQITKNEGTLSDIELSGGIGFESKYAEGSVDGSLVFKKNNSFKPEIKELNNATLKIPALGAGITVESVTQTDTELILTNAAISKTNSNSSSSDSPFNALMNKIPSVSAVMPKITYSFEKKKFIFSLSDLTFEKKDYEVDIIPDKLKGTFNPGTNKLGVTYTLAAPDSMKTSDGLPRGLGLDIDVPLVPGISVGGALFAGAGILMDTTGSVTLTKDETKTNFLFDLNVAIKKALAGIGVEAYIKFGVPGINATLGVRGQLLGKADPSACSLAAKLGINYEKGKGFSINDEQTSLSVALKADLLAQLQAFFRAKLFAIVDKELFSFTIAEKKIAGIEFSANAARSNGEWAFDASAKFIKPESPIDIFFNQKLVDWEKKANVKLDEAKKILDDTNNFFLTMRGLGYNETVLQSAVLINDIIPQLKTLRSLHSSSLKTLKEADKNYEAQFKKLESGITENYDIMQNFVEAEQVEKDEELFLSLRTMAKNAGITSDFSAANLKKLKLDINDPASKLFFMSPVQVVTYLSHIFHFNARGKSDTLAKVMKKYNKAINEVEWLYNHPAGTATANSLSSSEILSLIENQDVSINTRKYLDTMLSEQNTASAKTDNEIIKQAKKAEGDLKSLSKEISALLAINKKINAVQAKLDKLTEEEEKLKSQQTEAEDGSAKSKSVEKIAITLNANGAKKMELMTQMDALLEERQAQQEKYDDARQATEVRNLTKVNIHLGESDKQFNSNREAIKAARKSSYRYRFLNSDQKRSFDLFSFVRTEDMPGTKFFMSISEKNVTKAVDFKQFKKFVIEQMLAVANETKNMVSSFMGGATYRAGGDNVVEKSTMSAQMQKIIFSNEVYARAGAAQRITELYKDNDSFDKDFMWGKEGNAPSEEAKKTKQKYYDQYSQKTSEDDNIDNDFILNTLGHDRAQTTGALDSLDEKLNELESVIRTTNETYSKANETLVRLLALDMSTFSNDVKNDKGTQNPLMGESLNTLIGSDKSIKSELAPSRINELTEQTTELEKDIKKKVGTK